MVSLREQNQSSALYATMENNDNIRKYLDEFLLAWIQKSSLSDFVGSDASEFQFMHVVCIFGYLGSSRPIALCSGGYSPTISSPFLPILIERRLIQVL